jgi:Peptidase inhibitor I78 family
MNRTILLMMTVLLLTGCPRRDSDDNAASTETTAPAPAPDAGAAPAEPAPDQVAPTEPETPVAPAEDSAPPAGVAEEPEAGAGPVACDAEAVQRFVGEAYTPELGEQARVASGATIARALRPGEVVTMEFRADRLSLTLDESGRIVRASCG